jgi:hypothetical protein
MNEPGRLVEIADVKWKILRTATVTNQSKLTPQELKYVFESLANEVEEFCIDDLEGEVKKHGPLSVGFE